MDAVMRILPYLKSCLGKVFLFANHGQMMHLRIRQAVLMIGDLLLDSVLYLEEI